MIHASAICAAALLAAAPILGEAAPTGTAINPAAFTPGACIAYAPTAGDRHRTVFLDAGHGGLDPGAVGSTRSGRTILEARQTLPVELDVTKLLRRAGFRVVVSRTTDSAVVRLVGSDVAGNVLTAKGVHDDVAARDVCANDAHANLLVGIYFNASTSPDSAGAVTGYDAVRPFAPANLRFADLLQGDVLAAMNAQGWNVPDAGVLSDDTLGSSVDAADMAYDHLLLLGPAKRGYFSTPSQMPGALIEPLFITDPPEASIAASRRGRRAIAEGIALAVEQYFGR